jgi:hypothetical protein
VNGYRASIEAARFPWVVERSLLGAARAHLALKAPDQALTLVARLETEFPASVQLPEAWSIRGQAQAAKGLADQALATYAALTAKAGEWGREAMLKGAGAQAQLLAARRDFAGAAKVLDQLVQAIDRTQDPTTWAPLALDLARAQQASGNLTGAAATYRSVAFIPGLPGAQAQARLAMAKLVLATPPPGTAKDQARARLDAFDHAAIAAALVPGSPTAGEARSVLQQLAQALADAPDLSQAEKDELKAVLANL